METEVRYHVYRFYKEEKQLVGTYSDPMDAHTAAQRYNTPHTYITIEKTSKPYSEVGNY